MTSTFFDRTVGRVFRRLTVFAAIVVVTLSYYKSADYVTAHVACPSGTFHSTSTNIGPDFMTGVLAILFGPLLGVVVCNIYYRIVRSHFPVVSVKLQLRVIFSFFVGFSGLVLLLCWLDHALSFVCYSAGGITTHPTVLAASELHSWDRLRHLHVHCGLYGSTRSVFYRFVFDDSAEYELIVGASSEGMLLAVSTALQGLGDGVVDDPGFDLVACPPSLRPILKGRPAARS